MDFETKFSESADFRNGYIKSSRTWRGAIGAWFDTMTVRFLQSNNLTRNRFKDFQDRVNAEAEGNTRGRIIADMMHTGKQDVDMESGGREPHVPSDQHPVGVEQFRNEIGHLVGDVDSQVGTEVAPDVIGVEGFKFHIVYFLSVLTR